MRVHAVRCWGVNRYACRSGLRNGPFIEQHLARPWHRIHCYQLVVIPTRLKTSKQILTHWCHVASNIILSILIKVIARLSLCMTIPHKENSRWNYVASNLYWNCYCNYNTCLIYLTMMCGTPHRILTSSYFNLSVSYFNQWGSLFSFFIFFYLFFWGGRGGGRGGGMEVVRGKTDCITAKMQLYMCSRYKSFKCWNDTSVYSYNLCVCARFLFF